MTPTDTKVFNLIVYQNVFLRKYLLIISYIYFILFILIECKANLFEKIDKGIYD